MTPMSEKDSRWCADSWGSSIVNTERCMLHVSMATAHTATTPCHGCARACVVVGVGVGVGGGGMS